MAGTAAPTPAPTDNLLMLLSASPSPGPANPIAACHRDSFCHVRCMNTCPFASTGVCDDGEDGAETSFCQIGTDCEDCGRRLVRAPPLPPWPPPKPPTPPEPPKAPYSFFYNPLDPAGSEPADIVPCVNPGEPGYENIDVVACSDTCFISRYNLGVTFTSDGICDDGINTQWGGACPVGTDCTDCGRRCLKIRRRPNGFPMPPPRAPPALAPSPPPSATSPAPMIAPPAPPGSSYAPTLAFTLTVAGTIESFDVPNYKSKMASVLGNGITSRDVSLALEQGSVVVTTRVWANSTSVATALKGIIEAASASSLTAALGINVTDVSQPTVELAVVNDSRAQGDVASSTSASLALADAEAQQRSLMTIAIVLGVTLFLVISAVIFCVCWLRGNCGARHRRANRMPRFRQSGRARVVTGRNCAFTEHSIISPSSRFKADEFAEHDILSAASRYDISTTKVHDGDDAHL